ncbi:MAG TPA: GxxExxY protein [Chryseosolibacter sp.]
MQQKTKVKPLTAFIMEENEIAKIVVDCALKVHKKLGPGLLESSYIHCLCYELEKYSLKCEREKALPLIYEEVYLDQGYRLDLMIERKVIIEAKSVSEINDVHIAQLLTYLKLSECKLGLLINFNVSLMKNGIRRFVNGL